MENQMDSTKLITEPPPPYQVTVTPEKLKYTCNCKCNYGICLLPLLECFNCSNKCANIPDI